MRLSNFGSLYTNSNIFIKNRKILKNENNRLNVQELTSLKANSYNYLEKN